MIMSQETSKWLNENVLIGFTDQRNKAWHYRASDQGDEPNHYAGAVPVSDVLRRLFYWHAVKTPLKYTHNGKEYTSLKSAVIRDDTGVEMGSFKDGYTPHQYDEWLVHNVSNILDDSLNVSSAGLLKGGAVAWVEVSTPDTITTPEGIDFRPNILAATSFNGSIATTYAGTYTATVCDNTLSSALAESGPKAKFRHSRNSLAKISEVRDALGIIHAMTDEFSAAVAELTSTKVTEEQFEQLIDQIAPLPKPEEGKSTRGLTLAENKRDELFRLWANDDRVNPWRNTAFGAFQALNTYNHHSANVRGMSRPERNMLNAVNGQTETDDAEALELILALS